MTFRTESLAMQWRLWLVAALVAVVAYVVVSCLLHGTAGGDVLRPCQQRIALPILAVFALFAWETRWNGVKGAEEEVETAEEPVGNAAEHAVEPVAERVDERVAERVDERADERAGVAEGEGRERGGSVVERTDAEVFAESDEGWPPFFMEETDASDEAPAASQDQITPFSGEKMFEHACTIPHQPIPSFNNDKQYLDLLGKSAMTGYAPAMAKLGDYAMRRGAWVEAYYWMIMARRNGMRGLESVLREIRTAWATEGFPDQIENVNEFFPPEAGSLARALLHLDSGHAAASAREYLKRNYPEFIETGG